MVQGARLRDPFQQYDFFCPFALSAGNGLKAGASNPSLHSGRISSALQATNYMLFVNL